MWSPRWLDSNTSEFVTPKLARMAFGFLVGFAAVLSLGIMAWSWRRSATLGVVGIMAGVVVFLGVTVVGRIALEVALAVSRVARDTAEMVEHEAEIAVNTGRSAELVDRSPVTRRM